MTASSNQRVWKTFCVRKGENFVILHLKWREKGEKVKGKNTLEASQKNEERLKLMRLRVSEMPHWWKKARDILGMVRLAFDLK